jgi:hypothetical protein
MQAKSIPNFRFCLIGFLVLNLCGGCAALDRKLEDSQLTRKMWDWHRVLKEKFSADDADLSSAEQPPAEKNEAALQAFFEHQVCWPGESLSLIAKWYTGKYQNWQQLAVYNPQIDPKRIRIGQKILIPEDILITRDPLPRKVAAKYLPNYFAHTVRHHGETLTRVAGWYTGDPENWKALAAANPDLDPEFLAVGYEIYIPEDLLKTRKPPPQSDTTMSEPKVQKTSVPAEQAPAPADKQEIELFGPKQFPKG